MKIIYLIKEGIHIYPPCLTQILYLNEIGVNLIVYHGITDCRTIEILDKYKVKHYNLYEKEIKSKNRKILTLKRWIGYRRSALKILNKTYDEDTILWLGTADSSIAIYDKLKDKKYVLSILELYDNNKLYKKYLGKIVNQAVNVICCEYNRAHIMKSWWKLKKLPYVIPNKPYTDIKDNLIKDEKIMSQIRNKKIILYQGMIAKDRELSNLAKALKELDKDYWLVLMGKDYNNNVNIIKDIYEKTIYLGYIPAPAHLLYTNYAYMGIANYDYSCLNNIFCAPNKIYEYTGFKIPVLCNEVPGLYYTIGIHEAGICVDFDDIEEIKRGILKIEENYNLYSDNALEFYKATDNLKTMKKIVEEMRIQ